MFDWTNNDVCTVIKRKYSQGSSHGKVLQEIVKKRGINGEVLFKYHESVEHMTYLLFSKIDHVDNLNASDIGETFLDFDLTKLRNVTTRRAVSTHYVEKLSRSECPF